METKTIQPEDDYFVFISYSSKDVKLAQWLQHELEDYHLPTTLNGEPRQNLRKVFRDRSELSAGELGPQIESALKCSTHLVVVCSPNSAESEWVDLEIKTFIELHQIKFDGNDKNKIFPFIIEGNSPDEYFPETFKELRRRHIDLLGGDINKEDGGNDAAFLKVAAGLLNLPFDKLWNRYAREKAEKEQKEREQKEKLQISQSRFLAEKAEALIDEGDSYMARMLALEALPKDLEKPDRPYVAEAEAVLRKSTQKNDAIFRGHSLWVSSAHFNKSGSLVVSASNDNTIRVWDVATGRCVKVLRGHAYKVRSASFSPDEQQILSSSEDNTIRIWDFETEECVHIFNEHSTCPATYSPDGMCIAFASEKTIKILNVRTKNVQSFEGHSGYISSVAYSFDGEKIVSASYDKSIRIWDVTTGKYLQLNGHTKSVNSAKFSSDGQKIVSASWDNTIRIWNTTNGECVKILDKHTENVTSAAFNNKNNRIVSTSWDKTIRIWDANEGGCLKVLKNTVGAKSAIFSPNGNNLLVVSNDDYTIRYIDLENEFHRCMFHDNMHFVYGKASFNKQGNQMVALSSVDLKLCVFDIYKNIIVQHFSKREDIICASFSPDGKKVISAYDEDKTIRIWDVQTGSCLKELNLAEKLKIIRETFYILNGERIVVSGVNDKIQEAILIYDTHTWEPLVFPKNQYGEIVTIYEDANQLIVVSYSEEGIIYIWNLDSSECLNILVTGKITNGINTMDVHVFLNRKYLTIYNRETHQYDIWNLNTNTCVKRYGGIRATCFNDTHSIVGLGLADKTIVIIDLKTFVCKQFAKGDKGNSLDYSMCFSPDGTKIIVTTPKVDNTTLLAWSIKDNVCCILRLENQYMRTACFAPDNHHIISGGYDGIHIWDNPHLQKLINETCERFKDRELTSEEKRKYYIE